MNWYILLMLYLVASDLQLQKSAQSGIRKT
jgi:hypothetical protein